MNVRNCRRCGKIFNYVSGPPICQRCREGMEQKFQEVKEFIRENVNATLTEISETCEVEVSQLKQWVREERLCFADNSPIGIDCEGCGTIIKSGRFCDKCKNTMIKDINENIKKPEMPKMEKKTTKDSAKMRYLDN